MTDQDTRKKLGEEPEIPEYEDLPEPKETELTELSPTFSSLKADEYHKEVSGMEDARNSKFLTWDKSGHFRMKDNIVACAGGLKDLTCTIHEVIFFYQYWVNGQIVCENKAISIKPQIGSWKQDSQSSSVHCSECPKNSRIRQGGGSDMCKDSITLNMSVFLDGFEDTVSLRTSNFMCKNSLMEFLHDLRKRGLRLKDLTLEIGKGSYNEGKIGGKVYGWKFQIKDTKPLHAYLSELKDI